MKQNIGPQRPFYIIQENGQLFTGKASTVMNIGTACPGWTPYLWEAQGYRTAAEARAVLEEWFAQDVKGRVLVQRMFSPEK